MGNKQDVKRTLMAPTSARPVSGEPLSIELGTDEDVRWIWCHHGERGSSVIGYTIVPREPTDAYREAADRILSAGRKTVTRPRIRMSKKSNLPPGWDELFGD